MTSWRRLPSKTPPALGWARRVVQQQLNALSRLAAIAWRLIDPPQTPRAEAGSMAAVMAGLRGFEKAVRMQVRVNWAMRLIEGLRARLLAEMQDLDNGRSRPLLPRRVRLSAMSSDPP